MATRRRLPEGWQEAGQSVLALVIGLTLIIAAYGAIMAANVIQHDPLVQTDTVKHFSYRALEAGINTFLSDANKNPNELTCNKSSPAGGQCTPGDFESWKEVAGTSGSGDVPEWYTWGNPRFCFTSLCHGPTGPTTPTPHTSTPVKYVKITIYGAAGFTTAHMAFNQSTLNLEPVNGFLTRIWWSTYEATDPALNETHLTPPRCTWDWNNGYRGPTTGSGCSAVVYATDTQVYGPIYANDSIYITGRPKLGPVQTADPKCLFVTVGGTCYTRTTQAAKPRATRVVTQPTATFNLSSSGETRETLPTSDATLQKWASYDGCVYTGPTTIEFDSGDRMTVVSKDTPAKTATATTPACPSTHITDNGTTVPTPNNTSVVPNGSNGDGVIYVNTSTSCATGANPFDDYTGGKNGTKAQYATTNQNHTTYYDYFGAQSKPDCEGDAFVSDNPSGGGIQGQLTVGTSNDVVVTGSIKYLNCGATFQNTAPITTVAHPCNFNTTITTPNDSLGLIAQNYVLVNHPLAATDCVTNHGVKTCKVPKASSGSTLAAACTTAVLGTPAAALCNPVGDSTASTLTIDAAILALNHSFAVDNEALPSGGGVGGLDGTLRIYGSIVQKWRGAVGIVHTSGYVKYYDWNSVGSVITPPHYLAPSTPSWAISSSAILSNVKAPSFGAPPTS